MVGQAEEYVRVPAVVNELNSVEEVLEPTISPEAIENATSELMDLFEIMAGVDLTTGEKIEEPIAEDVIDTPLPLPTTYSTILDGSRTHNDVLAIPKLEPTLIEKQNAAADMLMRDWKGDLEGPKNAKAARVITDVTDLLERHRNEMPEEEYKILKTDAADRTADYLSKLNLNEFEVKDSMPFTGANNPIVSSPQFTTAVTGILRKMMATGPGTGVVDLNKLDDVDNETAYPSGAIEDGMVLAYRPNTAPLNRPYKWQAADTPPAGDIHDIVTAANSGLAGGANSGTVTLTVDASNLPALGAPVALTDYVVIYDADASVTKKVLVSTLFSTLGDITGVTAGTYLTGGGTSGDVTLNLDTGINATYLADGSVTNTELQYINSLTSNAQTQIDSKAGNATVTAMAIALG